MQINVDVSTKLSRRSLLIGATTFSLAGCVESPVIFNAFSALKYAVVGLPDVQITRDQISKIPYASIAAKIGKGPRSILILWRKSNDDLHWISADRAVVVTRNGRVVKTFGFPENLKDTQFNGLDPVNRKLHTLTAQTTSARSIDVDVGNRFGLPINSVFEMIGKRDIKIASLDIKTVLVKETNVARTINWSFTNYYWVDAFDGFIWKSRQHIARSFDPIAIEVLKPAV